METTSPTRSSPMSPRGCIDANTAARLQTRPEPFHSAAVSSSEDFASPDDREIQNLIQSAGSAENAIRKLLEENHNAVQRYNKLSRLMDSHAEAISQLNAKTSRDMRKLSEQSVTTKSGFPFSTSASQEYTSERTVVPLVHGTVSPESLPEDLVGQSPSPPSSTNPATPEPQFGSDALYTTPMSAPFLQYTKLVAPASHYSSVARTPTDDGASLIHEPSPFGVTFHGRKQSSGSRKSPPARLDLPPTAETQIETDTGSDVTSFPSHDESGALGISAPSNYQISESLNDIIRFPTMAALQPLFRPPSIQTAGPGLPCTPRTAHSSSGIGHSPTGAIPSSPEARSPPAPPSANLDARMHEESLVSPRHVPSNVVSKDSGKTAGPLSSARGKESKVARLKELLSFRTSASAGHSESAPTRNEPRVFGVALKKVVQYATAVDAPVPLPAVVYRCLEYLRANNAASEEGLFRTPGSKPEQAELRRRFEADLDVQLLGPMEPLHDVNAVADLLKSFLREVKEQLLTENALYNFKLCSELRESDDKVDGLNFLANNLPTENRILLEKVTGFLKEVVDNEETNMMGMSNILSTIGVNFGFPSKILETFISDHEIIFGPPLDHTHFDIYLRGILAAPRPDDFDSSPDFWRNQVLRSAALAHGLHFEAQPARHLAAQQYDVEHSPSPVSAKRFTSPSIAGAADLSASSAHSSNKGGRMSLLRKKSRSNLNVTTPTSPFMEEAIPELPAIESTFNARKSDLASSMSSNPSSSSEQPPLSSPVEKQSFAHRLFHRPSNTLLRRGVRDGDCDKGKDKGNAQVRSPISSPTSPDQATWDNGRRSQFRSPSRSSE